MEALRSASPARAACSDGRTRLTLASLALRRRTRAALGFALSSGEKERAGDYPAPHTLFAALASQQKLTMSAYASGSFQIVPIAGDMAPGSQTRAQPLHSPPALRAPCCPSAHFAQVAGLFARARRQTRPLSDHCTSLTHLLRKLRRSLPFRFGIGNSRDCRGRHSCAPKAQWRKKEKSRTHVRPSRGVGGALARRNGN